MIILFHHADASTVGSYVEEEALMLSAIPSLFPFSGRMHVGLVLLLLPSHNIVINTLSGQAVYAMTVVLGFNDALLLYDLP